MCCCRLGMARHNSERGLLRICRGIRNVRLHLYPESAPSDSRHKSVPHETPTDHPLRLSGVASVLLDSSEASHFSRGLEKPRFWLTSEPPNWSCKSGWEMVP